MDRFGARSNAQLAWDEANRRGIALARAGEWLEADAAFHDASVLLDAASADQALARDERDAMRAKLYTNRANACFHASRTDEARRFAERSCALRVSVHGEDSLSGARARADLATILGAIGQTEEALSLLDRAMLAVECKLGMQSAHLTPLLRNRVRLLVLTGREQEAEEAATRLAQLTDALRSIERSIELDIADDEMTLSGATFDLVEPPPPTLSTLPNLRSSAARENLWGFDVEYGIPQEHHRPLPGVPSNENPTNSCDET
jgi:tetratricopeptide (TPR) repeat protein